MDHVPRRLLQAATLILDTGPIDATLIQRMVKVLRGVSPTAAIGEDDCRHLDIVDPRMAFRPGLGPDEIIVACVRPGEPEQRRRLQ